ncbi:DNA polymerase IV [Albimonas sp. CAU 1670]|uniref:DNA polymerase IV n=1 Tax=Albimonas sp. CAU 1670 TaxID=3032599 RepID=UPI0023DAC051|nr:DNA polymerase IV [Albimonas sp. CAU 1670]MDF2233491.1 DNA polymerase IV [Albimonas sp. CAU 1670]
MPAAAPTSTPALCRDCGATFEVAAGARPRCPLCRSPRALAHPELHALSIAHLDCDAFYASVEKRDDPGLRDVPLIIGGGRRGVVSTACYIARTRGVRSAMPMFKALKLCPEAVVLKPRMEHYAEVSRQIRALMDELTPLIEPLSLDEAFLDLGGTHRLHGMSPAAAMARLIRRIETEVGVSASVGLSHNKFLAKIASDLDKPRGFSIIGRAETEAFLIDKPIRIIWGIGEASAAKLEAEGLRTLRDILRADPDRIAARHGAMGARLLKLARGQDDRRVASDAGLKSISNETTFETDVSDVDLLDGHLWRMAEKAAGRAKAKGLAGRTVTLKLKRADFRLITRRTTPPEPVQLADRLYRIARPMLQREMGSAPFRLLGVGISDLAPESEAERSGDLLDPDAGRRSAAEKAADSIRARFGKGAILKGRSLR